MAFLRLPPSTESRTVREMSNSEADAAPLLGEGWGPRFAELVGDASWTAAPEGPRFTQADAALGRLLDLDDKMSRLLEGWWWEWTPREDWPLLQTALAELESGVRRFAEVEHRVVRRDGKIRRVENRFGLISATEGRTSQLIGVVRDVTHRRREATLRFQSQLLESLGESVFAVDLEGRIVYWGRGAVALYGYAAEEIRGESVAKLVEAKAAAEQLQRFALVRNAGVWRGEYLQRTKRGRRFWADASIALVRDADGAAVGMVSIDRDTTARHRIEEQLQARTQQLQALTDNAPDLIARVDRTLRYLFVSQTYAAAIDVPPQEAVGRTNEELGAPDDFCRAWRTQVVEVLETGRPREMEFGLGAPLRHYQALVAPETRSGARVETVVVIARDVTAHRQADQRLQAAEERFRLFMELSPAPAFIKDEAGRYVDGNKALQRLILPGRGGVVGCTDEDIFPENAARLRSNDLTVLQSNTAMEWTESVVTASGLRYYLVVKFPLTDIAGRRYVGGIALDVTERQQAEDELHLHQATLAHVARLSTMGEMVAGIAHEIAQPLSAIANFASASKANLSEEGASRQKVREWVDLIGVQAQRAGDIIDRLRKFVRGAEPQRAPCPIDELIQDSISLVMPDAKRHQVAMCFSAKAPDAVVLADGVQIQQVLVNLLRNACEAMHETPRGDRIVQVSVQAADEELEVCVADAGSGMSPETRARLLDAFFTTKPTGMGMGLAVSRRIIEGHGGRLWATDNTPRGACFHFTLPRAR